MTKERYAEIRNNINYDPLFSYYLERGGYVKNLKIFKQELNAWLLLNHGTSLKVGGRLIIQHLDKKYQYKK